MIMDFVNGGELFHHLQKEQRFNEERTRFYAAQISSAVAHLHANGIIYRDLKPENLLLCATLPLVSFLSKSLTKCVDLIGVRKAIL